MIEVVKADDPEFGHEKHWHVIGSYMGTSFEPVAYEDLHHAYQAYEKLVAYIRCTGAVKAATSQGYSVDFTNGDWVKLNTCTLDCLTSGINRYTEAVNPRTRYRDLDRKTDWTVSIENSAQQPAPEEKPEKPFFIDLLLLGKVDITLCTIPERMPTRRTLSYKLPDGHEQVVYRDISEFDHLEAVLEEYVDNVKGYMDLHKVGILEYEAVGNTRCVLFTDGSVLSLHQGNNEKIQPYDRQDYDLPAFPIKRLKLVDPEDMEKLARAGIASANMLSSLSSESTKTSQIYLWPSTLEELQYVLETITESVKLIIPILTKYFNEKDF
jgi:hypothetical protein